MMEVLPRHSYSAFERDLLKAMISMAEATVPDMRDALAQRMEHALSAGAVQRELDKLCALGLVEVSAGRWRPTELGWSAFRPASLDVLPSDFSPFDEIASDLLPFASDGGDAAHDLTHILRVWRNAVAIQAEEGGDLRIIAASVMLHDAVNAEKSSPARSLASRLSGELASVLLARLGWNEEDAARVRHAVEAHSHSAGIAPKTIEARIVQDADRLDSLGMIGVARCFHVSGRIGRALYDPIKINGGSAPFDDIRFSLDHFDVKLFGLAATMQTPAGRHLADLRTERMRRFHEEFIAEALGRDG